MNDRLRRAIAAFSLSSLSATVACAGVTAPVQRLAESSTAAIGRHAAGASSSCSAAPCIYVSNSYPDGSQAILGFALQTNGNRQPVFYLNPDGYSPGIALDAQRNIYLTGGNTISVYPPGGSNPSRLIFGSRTQLNDAIGIAIGANGNIFVANSGSNTVTAYSAKANGNVAPFREIGGAKTGLDEPNGIATDGAGLGTLYVANSGANTITYYGPGASGNVAPTRTISGPETGLNEPGGLALGARGIYVANQQGNSALVYPADANGDAEPSQVVSNGLDYPTDVAVGASGYIYIANQLSFTVTVFAPDANGSDAPIRTIKGKNTGLYLPSGIAVR